MTRTRLDQRAFFQVWTGTTSSGLATWALPFALGFLVLDQTLSANELGLVLAFRTAGFLLAVPVSGVLADSGGRRRMVFASSLVAAFGMAIIILAFQLKSLPNVPLLVIGCTIVGIGQGACRPAYQALVPLVVPAERLQGANAAMSLSVRASTLAGPTVAAIVATAFGAPALLTAIAALWLVSAVLPPWPVEVFERHQGVASVLGLRRFFVDIADGFAEARKHPWFLAGLSALTAVIATGYSVSGVMVPAISEATFGDSRLLVATSTAYTAGALLAAIVLSKWRPRNAGWWALSGMAVYCLVPLSLLVPGAILFPVIAFFIAGFGIELFNIFWFTAVQREVSPPKLARVSSLDFLLSYGLAPMGLVAIAPVSSAIGVASTMVVACLACVMAPLAAAFVQSSRHFRS